MMTELEPLVRGPRASLRLVQGADYERFQALARLSRELHEDWVSAPCDRESFDAYMQRASPTFKPLVVVRRSDGDLAGVFNISQIFLGPFCSAYLGYYAFSPSARQGYMSEGMSLLLHYAFLCVGLHRIEANIQPENSDSIRLARRCGFEREGHSRDYLYLQGRWRDHERWAMRREIWTRRDDVELHAPFGPQPPV